MTTPPQKINLKNFRPIEYEGVFLYFDKNYSFHKHFDHKLKTKRFPYHKNLIHYLKQFPKIKICFTLDEKVKPFIKNDNVFLINIDSYLEFCKGIGSCTVGRAKAFLGQHLNLLNILFTEKEKSQFIKNNATEDNLLDTIKSLPKNIQKGLLKRLNVIPSKGGKINNSSITEPEFLFAFQNFLSNKNIQTVFVNNIPRVQLSVLKQLLEFLDNNLDKGETFIQNWVDEDKGKYRKQRCLIFGLEYTDPKREGELNRKRFDILAEQDREHHILIELKSPSAEIFNIKEEINQNEGKSTEYSLSPELSRAIPQILGYKDWYKEASDEELEKLGIKTRKSISECMIVIGKNVDNSVWKSNLERLRESFSGIKIITYTDLIDKLKNTIRNLEENLN